MDFATTTEDMRAELESNQENALLDIVKEVCSEPDGQLSPKLRSKVKRIIADCDLRHYTSLHRVGTADESTATLLGFMHKTSSELTFEEQAELNQAFVQKIESKIPSCVAELEHLQKSTGNVTKLQREKMEQLQKRDNKLDVLQEQEREKMELMLEWLNHRIRGVGQFSESSTELLTLKSNILHLKTKILHLQILQKIFTETNQSIKAYSEIHQDLSDSIQETEQRIKQFRAIIESGQTQT